MTVTAVQYKHAYTVHTHVEHTLLSACVVLLFQFQSSCSDDAGHGHSFQWHEGMLNLGRLALSRCLNQRVVMSGIEIGHPNLRHLSRCLAWSALIVAASLEVVSVIIIPRWIVVNGVRVVD